MNDSRTLLAEIDAFLRKSEMAPATFGLQAINDGKLVRRLRGGSSVQLETASRIRSFITKRLQKLPTKRAAS